MFDISKVPVGLRDLHNSHMTSVFWGEFLVLLMFVKTKTRKRLERGCVSVANRCGSRRSNRAAVVGEMVSAAFRMTWGGWVGGEEQNNAADGISGPRL